MKITQVAPGLHQVSLGIVNVFLLEDGDTLALVDTGVPGSERPILEAVATLGRRPSDVRHIIATHCHTDHTGSLAALKQATGATVYMHPEDAALVRQGRGIRPMKPAPGLMNRLIYWGVVRRDPGHVAPVETDREVREGDEIPVAGGLRVYHVPGHAAGQIALLWPQHGGVLFAADTSGHVGKLGLSPGYEDLAAGRRSLRKLAGLAFEVACFGHGSPIRQGASGAFRAAFGK